MTSIPERWICLTMSLNSAHTDSGFDAYAALGAKYMLWAP